MTKLIEIGLRWVGGLMLICLALLMGVTVLDSLRHSPQITYGIEVQHFNPANQTTDYQGSTLMAYDVWSGRSAPMISRLNSLPVAWSWSPDGHILTYVEFNSPNNTYSVVAFTPDTRESYVVAGILPFGSPPEWSPDGSQIALVSMTQDICLYTIGQPQTPPDCLNVMPASQPTWSSDMSAIAYISRLPGGGIYKVDVASRVVSDILPNVPYLNGVRWSPDGTRLVFSSQEAPGTPRRLMLINADGTNLTELTAGLGNHDQARWSDDGEYLVYNYLPTSFRSPDIYMIRVSDKTVIPVATHPLIDADPHGSPDGDFIAFVTDRYDSRPRLQIVPVPIEGEPEPIPGAGVGMHLYSYDWRP